MRVVPVAAVVAVSQSYCFGMERGVLSIDVIFIYMVNYVLLYIIVIIA